MTREFEKMVAKKISIYQATLKMANNGVMPKNKAELVTGLLKYLLDLFPNFFYLYICLNE
jgi:hypothetical protein